jgi:hypothetical protein
MRLKPFVSLLLALSLCSPAFAQNAPPAPPPAPPSPSVALADALTGQAKEEYDSGKLLFGDGDYAGAALKFQRAYELSKDPRLLWNMAATEKYLRRYTRVESLLKQYLVEGGPYLTDADRTAAQGLLETMGTFIAEVTFKVDEPGAKILVDEAEVGTSPLDKPVRVDQGARKFRVTKPGFGDFTATQTLAGGATVTLDVDLVEQVHEGRLRVSAENGAEIFVDGKMVGKGQWEGRLASGTHRVEVKASGKQPWRSDSVVQDGQLTTVAVSLSSNQQAASGVPTWMWIAGGVVAAAGLSTGAYFLFRPEDKGPPPATQGSFGTVELPFRL